MKTKTMETVVNEWPDSQECIGCIHAVLVLDGRSSTYSCDEGCIASSAKCKENRKETSAEEWSSKF